MAQNLEGAQASFKLFKYILKQEGERNYSAIPTRREMLAMLTDLATRCEELAKHNVKLEAKVIELQDIVMPARLLPSDELEPDFRASTYSIQLGDSIVGRTSDNRLRKGDIIVARDIHYRIWRFSDRNKMYYVEHAE